ncbi:MAG: hypothetical protein BZY88_19500 [SAR202 cluster bacterium Io17-Chloro-G9]|nr:MAG: hypothetical protein BZY88_19500 [SAR202 cluster bacterium Io17-Chloro-G9]
MAQASQQPPAAFQESHLELEGLRLRYMEASPPHPDGTVVMVDANIWGLSKLHHALAQKYRVVALELPAPAQIASRSVKDLAGIMNQAVTRLASEKYTLIGTSLGANVALWQTLQSPDQVEALVLISPTAILPSGGPAPTSPEEVAKRLFAHQEDLQEFSRDSGTVAGERGLVQRIMGTAHDGEAESKLGEIQCAALVVFGLQDKMVAPEAGGIFRENISNSNLSFVYDTGHIIVAERPEALIDAVSDFVERRETFVVGRQSSIINP